MGHRNMKNKKAKGKYVTRDFSMSEATWLVQRCMCARDASIANR